MSQNSSATNLFVLNFTFFVLFSLFRYLDEVPVIEGGMLPHVVEHVKGGVDVLHAYFFHFINMFQNSSATYSFAFEFHAVCLIFSRAL